MTFFTRPTRRAALRLGVGSVLGLLGCQTAEPTGSRAVTPSASPSRSPRPMSASTTFTFVGGRSGPWRVTENRAVTGQPLELVERLDIVEGNLSSSPVGAAWLLRGFTSNVRYATEAEVAKLKAVQPPLGRPEATVAVLIPIRKTSEWWNLPQDRRRAIFEESSHHTQIGLEYLPAVARKLHHSRDLGEPFDFLTWFEFAPAHADDFDKLLSRLRASAEWRYVDREAELRLVRG